MRSVLPDSLRKSCHQLGFQSIVAAKMESFVHIMVSFVYVVKGYIYI